MISFEEYRKAYIKELPDSSENEMAQAYMEYIGPPAFLDELASGAARGAGQVLEGIGAAVRILSGDQAGQDAVKLGQELIEAYPRHPEIAGSIIENPKLLADPAWWAGGVGEMAPFLLPQAGVAGGLLKAGMGARGAIGAAAATGGVLEGAPTFNRMMEQGQGYGTSAMKAGANIAGIGALNLLPLSRAFGFGPSRGAFNRVMSTALGEGVTEVAEEPLGAFIEGNDPVEALYQGINVFPVAALTGGALGGVGAGTQQNMPQPAPAAQPSPTTPLSLSLAGLENPEPFNQDGEQAILPTQGWLQDEEGALKFSHDPRLITDNIDYTQDNSLEQLIDDPVAYEAYPELRQVAVGGLPTDLKGMQARSVPGRIEVAPDLKGDALLGALTREMQRQIAYAERLQIPGTLTPLKEDQVVGLIDVVDQVKRHEELEDNAPELDMLELHARQTLAPNTPQNIDAITSDQENVALSITPRQAQLLVKARQLDRPATDVVAAEPPAPEHATSPVEQEALSDQPTADPSGGVEHPPSSDGAPPNMSPPGGTPTDGDRPSDGNRPPGGGSNTYKLPEFIGNIRTANLFKGKAEAQIAEAVHDINAEQVEQQRRGVRTNVDTIEEAERIFANELGIDFATFKNTPIGTIYNSDQQVALRAINRVLVNRTRRAGELYNENPSTGKLEAFMLALAEQRQVWLTLTGSTAEAGRLLQSQKIQLSDADIFARITQSMDPDEVLDVILSAQDTGEFNAAMQRIERAKVSDVLLEVWLAGLLSGPTTHVVNALSNTLTGALYRAEVWLAVGIGKLTGNQAVSMQEAVAYTTGHLADMVEGARAARKSFATEADVFQASKLDQLRFQAITSKRLGVEKYGAVVDKAGRGIRVPFRLLMGADAYFKTRAYRRRLRQLGIRKALKENPELSGQALADEIEQYVLKPSKKMVNDAVAHANYLTFTNPTGIIAGSIKRIAAKHPILKIPFPFVQTPANILKFAFSRSPLAILSKNERSILTGKQGKEKQVMAQSRLVLGSSIMGFIGYMAAEGLVTGAPPADPRERRLWYARGLQPYSFKVGDTWLAYGRLEPMGILVGVTADVVTLWDALEADYQFEEMLQGIVGGMSRNLLSKTYLKGISDLILAITDPERYGDRYIQAFSGTIVPTGIAQLQRAQDPYLRYTTSVFERIKSRLPFVAGSLPKRVDVFGNDIRLNPESVPDALNLANPIYISTYTNDPVAKELLEQDVLVSAVRKKIGNYELEPVELTDYQRTVGKLLHSMMNNTIRSPLYRALPAVHKRDRLIKVRREAMKLGRELFLARNPSIMLKSGVLLFAERAGFESKQLLIP